MQEQANRPNPSWALGIQDDGVAALLERPPSRARVDPKALFLGPKAENGDLVEQILLKVYRDHAFWRRNFHPEDPIVIQPDDQRRPAYEEFVSRFERELFTLLRASGYDRFTLAEIQDSPDRERLLQYYRALWHAYTQP